MNARPFLFCSAWAYTILSASLAAAQREAVRLTDEARRLHASCLVFDGHNDLPWEIRTNGSSSFDQVDIAQRQPKIHTDIPRLREGGVGAQFWSVYVPYDTALRGAALTTTLEQIDLVRTMIARYPDAFELALSADDVERIHQSGKIASLIGVEGGHSIENSLSALRQLYDLGARYMTLTHSSSLQWADSATDEPRLGGLAPFGVDVVHEMNRLGMLVDLSHVSPDAMKDALEASAAPVIFSHSSARKIADHPRNVPDDVLPLVAKNGGVVMVNFFSSFVVPEAAGQYEQRRAYQQRLRDDATSQEETDAAMARWDREHAGPRGTIHTVVDHIDHIARTAGVDHVGLGSDYDGVPTLPEQLEDVSCYPLITQALLDRGYSPDEIRKILGANILRVLRKAEQVATERLEPTERSE